LRTQLLERKLFEYLESVATITDTAAPAAPAPAPEPGSAEEPG
jgi:hypothetical protein